MNSSRVKLQHRPFLTPIWLTAGVAFLAFLFALFCLFAIWTWGTADATTVIVVSEAPATDPGAPAPPAADSKATRLAQSFVDAKANGGLSAIYVADTPRSGTTAAPLAHRLNLTPVKLPASDVKGIVSRALHDFSGGRVLVVAPAEMVPKIVSALEDDSRTLAASESVYDTLYIVSVPRIGHTNLLKLRY